MSGVPTTTLYRRSNGQALSVRSDRLIGSGGEGSVYSLDELPDLVAKVYLRPSRSIGLKLTLMVDNPPEMPAGSGHVSIAWPVDTLCDALPTSRENVVGFLMPRIGFGQPVNQCYSPFARRQKFPHYNYKHLCAVAINIAIAVNAIHAQNYVIGDLNETNIMVNENGLVTLIDTDSFQVIDQSDGTVFRSPVGKAEYTPAELQGHSFDAVDRDQYHDRFGLAVIIFQLLMEGRHPYVGRYLGQDEPPAIEDSISRGYFLHSENRAVPFVDGPGYMPWASLDGSIGDLFRLCFETGHDRRTVRPTPAMWEETVTQAARSLATCRQNPQHLYFGHNAACSWCERRNMLGGRDPFPGIPGPDPFLMRSATTQHSPGETRRERSRPRPQTKTSRRRSTAAQTRTRTPSTQPRVSKRIRWRLLAPAVGASAILAAVGVLALGVYLGWWILPSESRPVAVAVDLGAASSVSAGIEHSCRVRGDLSVVCWGDNQYGQSSPPQGSFTLVSAGQSHSCGLSTGGSVVCWGNHSYGQSSPPEGVFTSVSAGLNHNCGVKTDGLVECWGGDDAGKSSLPVGAFASISAGWYHTCSIDTHGTLSCWGDDAYGQSTPPSGNFTSVSAGQRHSCGVNSEKMLVCWGSNDNGQARPPGGTFVSVSAGSLHNCGLKTDGFVECWGNDHYGQARPPDGAFASVSSGLFHSCGVRTNGSVECWGSDEIGQSAPPMPQLVDGGCQHSFTSTRITLITRDGCLYLTPIHNLRVFRPGACRGKTLLGRML